MAGLTSQQLQSMRRTLITTLLADQCLVQRTGTTLPVNVSPDQREHHLPGAASVVRMRRWVLTLPDAADVLRYDLLVVDGMGTYWVAELLNPQTYSISTDALCWQLADAAGVPIDVVTENCSVNLVRGGGQLGYTRRARFMPAQPGVVGPMGERLEDTLYVDAGQTDFRLNDVVEIVHLDGFGELPHPSRWRCQNPRYVSEPPSFISIELIGEAGSYQPS